MVFFKLRLNHQILEIVIFVKKAYDVISFILLLSKFAQKELLRVLFEKSAVVVLLELLATFSDLMHK